MIGPQDPKIPPFVGDAQFIRGLEVGISLASIHGHIMRAWGMGAMYRDEILRGLHEEKETLDIHNRIVIHVHEQGHVHVTQGLDAEAVERLIKLAAQGKESAA